MSVRQLMDEISRGWPGLAAAELSLRIVEFMAPLKEQELRMLTIPTLLKASGHDQVDRDFLTALAILAGSSVHVLDAKAILTDEFAEEFDIESKELAAARREGSLAHPENGKLIADFEDRLIPYFESSDRFLQARQND